MIYMSFIKTTPQPHVSNNAQFTMAILIASFLAIFHVHVALSQCVNRPPNIVYNRQLPETIVEAFNPLSLQPPIFEAPNLLPYLPPGPTTIITDCTPTVCKNLANTIQLMIVTNLLKNTKGGSELAAQLASPLIGEVLSSPALSCPCTERRYMNTLPQNIISPAIPNMIPGLIGPSNVVPGALFQNPAYAGVNNNGLLGNILGILS